MDISVVIPLLNEEESLKELHDWIVRVMKENRFDYEIIFIDDGSSDNSWKIIEKLKEENNNVKAIKFQRNYGKSAALFNGFLRAEGDVVITMDADLQDSPDEIPDLYKMIKEEGYDLVSGWKKKRYDPLFSKNIPSKLFNYTASKISGIKLHDFNCGLKAYKKQVIKTVEVYGEMHRYIPFLAKQAGFTKIGEKIVTHQKRKYGVTKFGIERFIYGFLDLLSIVFISKFGKRPMHFFGTMGTLMFLIGGFLTVWIIGEKIYCLHNNIPVRDVVAQPLFFLSLLLVIIGVQLFLAGFIGELISRNSSERNKYFIEKEI
jgi:glycosyltransferase involved in cell wall biosynthesis